MFIHDSWLKYLRSEFMSPYFFELTKFVKNSYQESTIYPPVNKILAVFNTCSFHKIKVVILGQDPYHETDQANGLAFAVNKGTTIPPSLRNIFKEINNDLGEPARTERNLLNWSKQGVLLLNATLTVQAHMAGSHQNRGWETFTDKIVKILNNKKENLVFMLWGAYAQKKGLIIDKSKHLVLKSSHPSPFSAYKSFFGCRHFSKTNNYLKIHGEQVIAW